MRAPLGRGLSEAEALRQAQLGFLAEPGLHHPFYWAPYVLLGDGSQGIDVTVRHPSPLEDPRSVLALGALLLVAGLWSWRRDRRV